MDTRKGRTEQVRQDNGEVGLPTFPVFVRRLVGEIVLDPLGERSPVEAAMMLVGREVDNHESGGSFEFPVPGTGKWVSVDVAFRDA